MGYVSLTVTTEQNPAVDTQKMKREDSQQTSMESRQISLTHTHTHTRARESERNKRITEQSENNKMATVSSHLSIITLNVNAFSSSIEMHRVAEWIKKNKTQLYVS